MHKTVFSHLPPFMKVRRLGFLCKGCHNCGSVHLCVPFDAGEVGGTPVLGWLCGVCVCVALAQARIQSRCLVSRGDGMASSTM